MKILFITQYFTPETEIGGIRILEIAAARDYGPRDPDSDRTAELSEWQTFEGYRRKAWRGTWTETISGLHVTRVPLFPSHDKKTLPRLLNYFSFLLASAARALFLERPGCDRLHFASFNHRPRCLVCGQTVSRSIPPGNSRSLARSCHRVGLFEKSSPAAAAYAWNLSCTLARRKLFPFPKACAPTC